MLYELEEFANTPHELVDPRDEPFVFEEPGCMLKYKFYSSKETRDDRVLRDIRSWLCL